MDRTNDEEVDAASEATLTCVGQVLRTGTQPVVHLPSVLLTCTRAAARIVDGALCWAGTARVVATPDGAVLLMPRPIAGLTIGDQVEVAVTPAAQRSTVPDDIAYVLRARRVPAARWSDPEIRHLVRWVAEAKGALRVERLAVVDSTVEQLTPLAH